MRDALFTDRDTASITIIGFLISSDVTIKRIGEGGERGDIFLFSPVFLCIAYGLTKGRKGEGESTTRPEGRRWPDVEEFEQRNLC